MCGLNLNLLGARQAEAAASPEARFTVQLRPLRFGVQTRKTQWGSMVAGQRVGPVGSGARGARCAQASPRRAFGGRGRCSSAVSSLDARWPSPSGSAPCRQPGAAGLTPQREARPGPWDPRPGAGIKAPGWVRQSYAGA